MSYYKDANNHVHFLDNPYAIAHRPSSWTIIADVDVAAAIAADSTPTPPVEVRADLYPTYPEFLEAWMVGDATAKTAFEDSIAAIISANPD